MKQPSNWRPKVGCPEVLNGVTGGSMNTKGDDCFAFGSSLMKVKTAAAQTSLTLTIKCAEIPWCKQMTASLIQESWCRVHKNKSVLMGDSGNKCTGAVGWNHPPPYWITDIRKTKTKETKKRHGSHRIRNPSLMLRKNKNMSSQCIKLTDSRPEVLISKQGGLTQNMMLNPKMKYLMQQLTSWALKCFPDIIWMDFRLQRRQ